MYLVEYYLLIEDGAAAWVFWGLFNSEQEANDAIAAEHKREFDTCWQWTENGPPEGAWETYLEKTATDTRVREVKIGELEENSPD